MILEISMKWLHIVVYLFLQAERILKEIGLPVICETLNTSNEKLCVTASQLVSSIINAITDVDAFKALVKEQTAMKRRGERVKPAKFIMGNSVKILLRM